METDVKTLIAALTTERNAIDRAIAGLKAMSDMRAEMAEADARLANLSETARTLSARYNVNRLSIAGNWRMWLHADNGAQTVQAPRELVNA